MRDAPVWMAIGSIVLATGLVWLLSAEGPAPFAWVLVVVGGLRLLASALAYRGGHR